MIPKIIHYCWFGRNPIPEKLQICMKSWKELMPDYQIVRWDEDTFDVNSTTWTRQAYEAKKYAFVSDYVRMKALYEQGGIYFDTDVKVIKPMDEFLQYQAFTGFESKEKLLSAVIGAEKGFPLIKEFLDSYKGLTFLDEQGNGNKIPNVVMMTDICCKYGMMPNNTYQVIQGMHIFPQTYFSPLDFFRNKDFTENTHTIHYFDASWLDEETKQRIEKERTFFYKLWCRIKSLIIKVIRS